MTARQFETVKDITTLLASWADFPPQAVTEKVRARELRGRFGERHGSWFFTVEWTRGSLLHSASLAITNAGVTADNIADQVVVSVQAAASSATRFVAELLYESRRRTIKRISVSDLMEWIGAAVAHAHEYNEASLVQAYDTGVTQ